MTIWSKRAENLLEAALGEVRSSGGGDDAIIDASAALAALRIDVGELPEDELDGYPFPGEEVEPEGCICPPDLVARGGFRGGCPVHRMGGRGVRV